ncbi:MAG: HAD-IIB family hydrolase, partial [Chromatiales bacterium]|nr:HAD-IIB family hydrolase [Chromatiales bacterium]
MTKLAIFTDLDGTLLDHKSYDYSPALPALQRLEKLGFPVIFNSSKTTAELIKFSQELDHQHPVIAENGNVVAIPENYFEKYSDSDQYHEHIFGCDYEHIITTLTRLRNQYHLKFSGFNELGIEGVMSHTGLPR